MTKTKSVITSDDKKVVKEQHTATEKKLIAENEALKLALSVSQSREKKTKENSDYFCNNESERMSFKNLSETKRYFEINHSDILKNAIEVLKVDFLTSKAFHSELTRIISK